LKEQDASEDRSSAKGSIDSGKSPKKNASVDTKDDKNWGSVDTTKSNDMVSAKSGMTLYSLRDDNEVSDKSVNLTDKYAIAESLGKGGYGEVFLVTSLATNEKLAAKAMPKESSSMFQNEFAIARRLKHPNIIRLHDMCHFEGSCYLVFELCKGGDLFGFIESKDELVMYTRVYMPPPVRILAKWSWQMLHCLYYLHGHKIAHRDIKLENYLLTSHSEESANIKLIDFGFATKMAPGKKLTEMLGTAGYIAPEVLSTKGYDLKCDIWSVGVCIFLLFTGRHPIHISDEESNNRQTMEKKTLETEIDYKFISENYSKPVIEFIKELLEKDPTKRTTPKVILRSNEWLRRVGRGKSQGCCVIN
jgi:calcium-dependent protein kinase